MSSTSSTVCHQGLKSCLDEPLVRLKLTPPPPPPRSNFPTAPGSDSNPNSLEKISYIEKTDIISITTNNLVNNKDNNNEGDKAAGWAFIDSLTNPKTAKNDTEQVYVHPLVKRSSSVLSPKSLEMCTESLGSETGSENGGDDFSFLVQRNVDISLPSLESSGKINPTTSTTDSESLKIFSDNVQDTPKRFKRSSASTTTTNFPPPLTSICGTNGIQMMPHREGGRLVLKAVPVISPTAYFQAERGDGRLRLVLLHDLSPNCEVEEVGEDDEEEECAVEDDQVVEVKVEEEVEEEEEEVQMEAAEIEVNNCEENSGNVVGEMGRGKLPRPSRCKEGGGRGGKKMVMNWPESFWVAT